MSWPEDEPQEGEHPRRPSPVTWLVAVLVITALVASAAAGLFT